MNPPDGEGDPMKDNVAARLGGWSARRRKTAIFGWLLFVVAAVLIGGMAGEKQLTNAEQGTGDSGRAVRILEDAGIKSPATEMVLVHGAAPDGFRAAIPDVTRAIRGSGRAATVRASAGLPRSPGRAGPVRHARRPEHGARPGRAGSGRGSAGRGPRIRRCRIEEFGDASARTGGSTTTMGKDFTRAELTAVPLALGILLVVFGALVAAAAAGGARADRVPGRQRAAGASSATPCTWTTPPTP